MSLHTERSPTGLVRQMNAHSKELDFLTSALTEHNPFLETERFTDWFVARQQAHAFRTDRIPFRNLDEWHFDPATGNLRHRSGKFFSIEGIKVQTDFGPVPEWTQPIISQPEVGILGILTKKFDGILYFLMQTKMEPGNINTVQLAPTLQATRSNYTRVHGGRAPSYIEFFLDRNGSRVLVDTLQSEQGARFLRKRNRNIIIETTEEVSLADDYCWLTLGQLHKLIRHDNIVNMDARTVLSCIPFCGPGLEDATVDDLASRIGGLGRIDTRLLQPERGEFERDIIASSLETSGHLHDVDTIISWFTEFKTQYDLNVERIPLDRVERWHKTEDAIVHEEGKFFSVIAVAVKADNREVTHWTQPLVSPQQEGIVAFIVKKIGGILHFLVQAKVEAGNFDVIEIAPTVQCLTGSYKDAAPEHRPLFLHHVIDAPPGTVRLSTLQSEEGGRFFRESNRNMVIEVGDEFPTEVPDRYIWMTLNQIRSLIKYNNFLNVQCRSLTSSLGFL